MLVQLIVNDVYSVLFNVVLFIIASSLHKMKSIHLTFAYLKILYPVLVIYFVVK
jgi:hypothetical protein